MKKFLNMILVILILVFTILASFMIYSNVQGNRSSEEDLRRKVREEVHYLDSNLILILNDLNSISYEDYKVQTDRIETASGSNQSSGQSGNQGSNSEGGSDTGGENSGGNDSHDSTEAINQSKIISNNILNNTRDVLDWNQIKQTVETVYSSWAVIELDLHALNGNAEDILRFSDDLKAAILQIKNEDKTNSLVALTNCYSTLAKLVGGYETDNIRKQIMYTKAHILNAYAIVEMDRWDDCATYLKDAENSFQQVMNDVSVSQNKQADISKVYVLIKEMQESITLKDPELFYINYKNAMQSIENIS